MSSNITGLRDRLIDVLHTHDESCEKCTIFEDCAADAILASLSVPVVVLDNSFHIGETALEAMFDRVLVLVDVFKSGYECATCGGEQKVPCDNCDAGRSRVNSEVVCKLCHGSQTVPCPTCQGKGVKEGGIVVPETAQNPPQAGTIVSLGEDVGNGVQRLFGAVRVQSKENARNPLKIGDRVMFGRFAGHDLTISTTDGKDVPLRLLNESEVLCRMQGSLELRKIGKSTKEELL